MQAAAANTQDKALSLNLDGRTYGTFAEIGGGQEVARWFFAVGGAAGTVAKTISAYDMAVSDGIYGPAKRFVSRERLQAMLEREYAQLLEQLAAKRGESKSFFAFANTVATRRYKSAENGRGWMGVRFQAKALDEPSQVIIHAHLLDRDVAHEQEALGVLGVNLIHAALFQHATPQQLIASLRDDLSRERVEIDMVKFSGPAFADVDNRLMSLQLVERGLTDAAMFTASGEVVQPSEILYKRPILVERGSFRPATKLTLDLLDRAREQFLREPGVPEKKPVVLAEMTLRNLNTGPEGSHADFLERADILGALGYDALISCFEPYYQLAEYLTRYTEAPIALAVGLPSIRQIADEKYYGNLPGGIIESAGRLFKRSVKMYVYPTRDPVSGAIRTLKDANIPPPWHHLNQLLLDLGHVVPIDSYDESLLSIRTPDVLEMIRRGDPAWEQMVPPVVVEMIKAKQLFGWGAR